MTPQIEELIEKLRTARTAPQIASITARILAACGVYGVQAIGQQLCHMSVTAEREGIK